MLQYNLVLWIRETPGPVMGVLNKLITHLLDLLWSGSFVELAGGCVVSSLSLSLPINLLNLLTFLALTLVNLDSLTLLMK